jgi:Ca2+-transporting ATPase
MGRAATALAAGASVPWDAKLNKRAEDALTRMEGEGHRVSLSAQRVDHHE